ncbi:MAG: formate C-acetyltransferase/glycerol dehydratase family glycyl radical enzyme, partial [Deltaproteobacteria bacterium]|nr:formate C-acetyltransferase/glycerol dehydratase family glycyl radical enzyme [Deltaproteobacteria bacterium]
KDALKKEIAFYKASIIVADAAIEYGRRWKSTLEKSVEKTSEPIRKAELEELVSIFGNIPANHPSSFHEAVQMVFITHVILHQENFQHGVSFGRMDQYLYPYYIKDINSGKITPEKATEILGCFICKAGELLPLFFDRATEYFSGLSSASGITLGGEMPNGDSGVNDLSYLILLAYDQVRLRQPNFHVRIEDNTPPEFRHLCCEVLKKGGGIPAFFNDNTVIPALKQAGISNNDARDYAIVGCVEWGVQGKSFPAAGAVFINLAMAMQLALHDGLFNGKQFGPKTGPIENFTSMEVLLKAFQKQLINLLSLATQGNNAIETAHAKHRPTPFLSIVVEGCIENGTEVNAGGARYNSTGCQGVGLADVIDSFSAIDQIVFKKQKLSLSAFMAAVDNNFERHSDLWTYILNKVPKYGENSELSDSYAKIISGMYTQAVTQFTNPRKGSYFPGFWTMTTHMGFGTRMPALPSGRRAGDALANGASPCNGRDHKGPTASLTSASNLDTRLITNGYALNQKLNMDYLKGEPGNILLDGIILGYFKKGGMQIQFNIMDHSILADAKTHPQKYPDLVVRVSGYSAYFNDLTEAMKEELINRTLHCAAEGNCCT